MIVCFKRVVEGFSLVRKGPFVTFLGGDAALSQVQNESAQSNNIVLLTACLTTPILAAIFTCFKKYKLRKKISMVQRLKQTVFSGVSNLSGYLITFATLLVICIGLFIHLFWGKFNNKKSKEYYDDDDAAELEGISPQSMVILMLFMTIIHLIPFFRSCALRLTFIFVYI